jgi:D-glucosaminate-6-phosphate ammonia-lyase
MLNYSRLGVSNVINASGRMTSLGGSLLAPEVVAAMSAAAIAYVDLDQLKRAVGTRIAELAGAEAGWVTSGAAAGIAIMVAAVVAGEDPARIVKLPNADWEPRSMLLQAGHLIDFGAPVEQMVRLAGGRPVAVGSVNRVSPEHLEAEIGPSAAAVLFVQSHHSVQKGMLTLDEVAEICHRRRIALLVDAAAEEDLRRYVAAGVDLVAYSGGKAFEGPTSGIILGSAAMIARCRAQERGIARAMKVGKEQVLGLAAALEAHGQNDEASTEARERAILAALFDGLKTLPNTRIYEVPDEAGRPIRRLALAPQEAVLGFTAVELMTELARGDPRIVVRGHQARTGIILLDPRPLQPAHVPIILSKIRAIYRARGAT